MGYLDNGTWVDTWKEPPGSSSGNFQRKESAFRNWVTADGSPGPSGSGGFKAESGRYHLYVSWACPWAHRTLIFRTLKGLTKHVGLSATFWETRENGWEFKDGPGVIPDPINDAETMWQVYVAADPGYTGRVTVPVLWDRETGTIVNNESSEIIRMFNSAFDGLEGVDAALDLYPAELREAIDRINAPIYDHINNGVYKSGFANSQEAYDEAVDKLFETLDMVEDVLGRNRYLTGERITESDWRLFCTLVRFDPVYHGHFKCNRRRLIDYPNLWNFTRELYQWQGKDGPVADTVNFQHITNHYYSSHITVNPTLIVPVGPDLDYAAPHDRGERFPLAA